MEETLGFRNPVGEEKAATKKKVRVVKKIVKKKVIKKVLKRVSLASDCDDLENVVSTSTDVDSHVEIGKPVFDVDGLKEAEDVKELEGVHLVRTSASCWDESQIIGLVTSSLLGDQIHNKLQDSDQNQIEFMESDQNQIELKVSDQSRIELMDINQNRITLQDSDQNQIELQDCDHTETKLHDNDQNRIALLDSAHYPDRIELQDSDQNQFELPDRENDTNTMDVEEHEGEEGVKEVAVNSETDGLKSQEAFISESKVLSGKMVASRLHMKQITKIFIHGLGQKTKEEDIRKVFEEVGEVVEVKIITNLKTGKARGFGFIRFGSADLANLALTKYQNVEICGRTCHTAAIEGIDTILLDNIDMKWNNENVVELLQKIGIKKMNEVLVVPDPVHTELNCGSAFLEFETKKDAQMAYHQLQNETLSGKHSNIKVSWALPSVDPVEEEINSIKSVYAEHIPLFWDEKEVNDHFKMFGEIESIALAKNLRTAKRNDFAFINFKTREAALSCIEALTCKKSTSNNDPKVSLAKSIPKVKPMKTISDYAVTKVSQAYQKVNLSKQSQNQYLQPAFQSRQSQQNMSLLGGHKLPQKLNNMIGKHEDSRKDVGSSTTAELVQLLREQASWKHGGQSSTAGMGNVYHQPPSGGKQLSIEQGSKPLYHHDHRAYHQSHLQIPNVTHPRPVANMTYIPRYERSRYTLGSFNMGKPDPGYFQTRDQTTYPGSSSMYRQMH